jgi:hypothetical protein
MSSVMFLGLNLWQQTVEIEAGYRTSVQINSKIEPEGRPGFACVEASAGT